MIENVMHHLGGIGMYGIISICIFFGFFIGMLLWALRLRKPYLKSMSGLPLEDESARQNPPATPKSQPLSKHE